MLSAIKNTGTRALCLFSIAMVGIGSASGETAETPRDTTLYFDQRFSLGSGEISSSVKLDGFLENVKEVEERDTTKSVKIVGRASIDGPTELNNRLARERALVVRDSIIGICKVAPAKISVSSIGEDWKMFSDLVTSDEEIPMRDKVLSIISSESDNDQKETALRKLSDGKTWAYLSEKVFPAMRSAKVTWELTKKVLPPQKTSTPVYIKPEPEPVVEEVVVEEIVKAPEPADDWYRKMYIKTNAPAWALLWQNIALEVDLAKHWSLSVPVYWSPYNYGTQTLKFRTLAVVPEVRYWPKADNMGFFVNAHFGMAYYNYAKNEDYRYQDHDGKTPALGGGLGVGYRFYFCRNHHWSMEVAIGAGAYRLDYDIFLNKKNINSGYLVGREKRTFFGIDQAALTFSYSFGLKKKN